MKPRGIDLKIGVMEAQAKECWHLPEAGRAKNSFPLEPLERA